MSFKGLNKAMLIGHVGQDPKISDSNGALIANFSIATSESWKDKHSGEINSVTTWHRIVVFNRLAEIAQKYVRKGSMVYVEGAIGHEKYTGKDGVERTNSSIRGHHLQLLDKRGERGDNLNEPEANGNAYTAADYKSGKDEGLPFEDDEIPF
jgi:single-strand DNA-binding protein